MDKQLLVFFADRLKRIREELQAHHGKDGISWEHLMLTIKWLEGDLREAGNNDDTKTND